MYGQASDMVRCGRDVKGVPCPGMIEIPLGGKGQCPKCGRVCGLGEYHAERGRIVTKGQDVSPLAGWK